MRLRLPFIHQAFRPALTGTGNKSALHGGKFEYQCNMADQSLIVLHELTDDFDLENELFEDEDDLTMLSAVSCFMRRDLNRIRDYFEVTVPSYTPSEFRSHFRMTRGTCETLCREILNTGQIPTRNTRGRLPIPPVKQVLAFLWSMANQEPTRLVADRFNITMSSVDRVLHRGTQALADISAEYIKWPNGTCFYLWILFVCLFLFPGYLFLSDFFVIMNVFVFEASPTYIISAVSDYVYSAITPIHGLIHMPSCTMLVIYIFASFCRATDAYNQGCI